MDDLKEIIEKLSPEGRRDLLAFIKGIKQLEENADKLIIPAEKQE